MNKALNYKTCFISPRNYCSSCDECEDGDGDKRHAVDSHNSPKKIILHLIINLRSLINNNKKLMMLNISCSARRWATKAATAATWRRKKGREVHEKAKDDCKRQANYVWAENQVKCVKLTFLLMITNFWWCCSGIPQIKNHVHYYS